MYLCKSRDNIIHRMRAFTLSVIAALALTACHENIEDKAEREAREYTERYCPTPVNNCVRTDSVAFDKSTRVYSYYCTFTDKMDDKVLVDQHRKDLHSQLTQSIRESTSLKAYKEAGFVFAYVCRSQQHPSVVLYTDKFSPKDYR